MVRYIVYLGDEIKGCETKLETAKALYKSLPSGKGLSWTKRRTLAKETIILEDER